MKTHTIRGLMLAAPLALLAVLFEVPVSTHHSFAMYDQTKTVTLTGIAKQFVAQANHAEIHFYLIAPDRKGLAKAADGKTNVEWGVEMAGAAAVAQQGITASYIRGGHGVQREAESAARRVELRFADRRHRQVPGRSDDEQGQTAGGRQGLRQRRRAHVARRQHVLTAVDT